MNRVYGMEKLEQLLRDERFLQELAWERHLSDFYYAFRARALGERFGIKSWLYPVIAELIGTGDFKPELALEPVSIEVDRTSSRGLKLVLAEDISQAELRRYVTEHWKKDIEPELHGLAKGRETVPLIPERDERIYADYINRKKRGLTIVAIAMRNNVSVRTVNRIVRDKKKSL